MPCFFRGEYRACGAGSAIRAQIKPTSKIAASRSATTNVGPILLSGKHVVVEARALVREGKRAATGKRRYVQAWLKPENWKE
jgi:hypothetical protein